MGKVGSGIRGGAGSFRRGIKTGFNKTANLVGLGPQSDAMAKLRSHFESLQDGSMVIILDNAEASHPINRPITGKIKVNQNEPFSASALTLELHGYQTSSYFEEASDSAAGASNAPTGQSKAIFSEKFTIAEFDEGSTLTGHCEYAFSLRLPDSVTESLMIQFGENNFLSMTYYLRA